MAENLLFIMYIWVLSLEGYWFKLGVPKSLYMKSDGIGITPARNRLGIVSRCMV